MTCLKITESQNGQIYPEDTFSHGAAQLNSYLYVYLYVSWYVTRIVALPGHTHLS